ncbi:hypothetical protein EV175_002149 [Coemansia sp. RSA 1933]|nr:hypothetical protein EV175_002149 [Coemansia sp. RSA 1933]
MKKYFSRRLFVTGFPVAVTHGELTTRFEEYAFIDFNNSNEATLARSKLHSTKLRGYPLEVHFDNKIPQQFYGLLDDRRDDNGAESPGYSPPRPRHTEAQDDRGLTIRGSKQIEYNDRVPTASGYKDYDTVDDEMDRRNESSSHSVPYRHVRRPSPTEHLDDRRPMRSPPGSRKHHPYPPKRPAYHPYGPHGKERRPHHRQRTAHSPPPPPPPPPMMPQSRSSPRHHDEYYRHPHREEYDDRSSCYSDAESEAYSRERSRSYDRSGSPRVEDKSRRTDDSAVSREPPSSDKNGAEREFNEDILFSGP